jgi:hypothetical protein
MVGMMIGWNVACGMEDDIYKGAVGISLANAHRFYKSVRRLNLYIRFSTHSRTPF